MNIIDMQIYPVASPNHDALVSMEPAALQPGSRAAAARAKAAGLAGGLLVLLDPAFLRKSGAEKALKAAAADGFRLAVSIDFRAKDAEDLISLAARAGARSLKFHPYLQKITPADHARIASLCAAGEKLGLYPTICCSFGTRALRAHDGIALAAAAAERLKGPVVMAHAGGARILEAMLVAEDLKNVLLDTSFTLDYYAGSSIEGDLAFAIRKLGAARFMFGSDDPFIPAASALKSLRAFLRRHRFSDADSRRILADTAKSLL